MRDFSFIPQGFARATDVTAKVCARAEASRNMKRYATQNNIYCWDSYRRTLYRGKLNTFFKFQRNGIPFELYIDDEATYIRCFCTKYTRNKPLLYFSIFYDDNRRVSSANLREKMEYVKNESLIPLINLNYIPFRTHFEFHALEGFSSIERELADVRNDWKEEGITLIFPRQIFSNYRTFPEIVNIFP